MQKLDYYSIPSIPATLIKSYLDHRQQLVRPGLGDSALKTLYSGVPQGSILEREENADKPVHIHCDFAPRTEGTNSGRRPKT